MINHFIKEINWRVIKYFLLIFARNVNDIVLMTWYFDFDNSQVLYSYNKTMPKNNLQT